MDLIVAVARDWGIGKDNDLLFHIPEDMKYFRKKTSGSTKLLFPVSYFELGSHWGQKEKSSPINPASSGRMP